MKGKGNKGNLNMKQYVDKELEALSVRDYCGCVYMCVCAFLPELWLGYRSCIIDGWWTICMY